MKMIGLFHNFPLIKPFVRSREEVAVILESVLAGKMHCFPWDDFICIWIKGAPDMDAIRAACEELAPFETIGENGIVSHTPEAKMQIEKMLEGLRK